LSAPQAISVDFDATLVVQVVLLVTLTLVLKPLLFDPMLKLFEEREKRTDGVRLAARRIDEKSATALATYDAEMAKARAAANAERDAQRALGLKREQEILSKAREETAAVIEQGKQAVRTAADRARATLRAETPRLVQEVAAGAIGRQVES
jgi:F-type H+-transporting ATPase subunit b